MKYVLGEQKNNLLVFIGSGCGCFVDGSWWLLGGLEGGDHPKETNLTLLLFRRPKYDRFFMIYIFQFVNENGPNC